MQIKHVLIKVEDQEKALSFYTNILGLERRADVPGDVRWLTVASSDDNSGTELVLEPNDFAPARTAQQTLYKANFPAAILTTKDIQAEYERLKGLGVRFLGEPRDIGRAKFAFFDDTCGNWIVLSQDQDGTGHDTTLKEDSQ